jgi:CRP-like cAMP-binding protein
VLYTQNKLLAGLSQGDFDLLSPHLTLTSLPLGKVLCEPGDEIEDIYFPFCGGVSMLSVLQDGSKVECCMMGSETAFGLVASQQPSRSHTRDVVQLAGDGVSMSAKAMRGVIAQSNTLAPAFHRHLSVLLGFTAQSVACNARHKVEARMCRWLLTYSDYVEDNCLPLTQALLATMLGVRRTSVTEVAAGLQGRGIIKVLRGKVTVLDAGALKERSCECYAATRELVEVNLGPGGPKAP